MGIFTRFRDIVITNSNAMLDGAESPEKIIKLMIRETEQGLARCQRCDAEGGRIALKRQAPFAYKCAGGLLDAVAPITSSSYVVFRAMGRRYVEQPVWLQ